MQRKLALWVAFDGTDFHGWQKQPGMRTVQGVLEESLQRALRHPVDLVGSGRTDAGVHALAHVNSFATTSDFPLDRLQASLQSRLPIDLSIIAVREVRFDFHATQSAVSKLYRYRIHASQSRPLESFSQRYTYHCWVPLDIEAMQQGAAHFVGQHDFTSLAATGTVRESMVRTIFRCEVHRYLDEIHVDVEGDGFLWKQVRTMVGTLLQIGRGRWRPEDVREIIAARDRSRAGPTMPAHGLCLQWVRYPREALEPSKTGNSGGT